jgi:hypothetical protein
MMGWTRSRKRRPAIASRSRWQQPASPVELTNPGAFDGLREWVLSLPWVVERPRDPAAPSVLTFAVDCKPLACRRVWFMSGVQGDADWAGTGLAVVLPRETAVAVEDDGDGHGVALLAGGHVLVSLTAMAASDPARSERVLLDAYNHALSPSTVADSP